MGINFLKTIYINFKCLPFRQAIFFPVVLYNDIRIIRCSGKIVVNTNRVQFKMVQIGAHGSDMFGGRITTLDMAGRIDLNGAGVRIGHGSLIRVEDHAVLEFNENSIIGANNMIFCCRSISFNENTLFSWNCQIMDSDTHALYDMETKKEGVVTKPVIIGPNTWVGNHVLINKGTVLPEGVIVSSCSLCNKDYTGIIPPYSVIGGVPVKLLKEKMRRKSLRTSFMDSNKQW